MDWILLGGRLLGLAVLGVWEYFLFKQRFATRTGKLRAKQIDGASAVLAALTPLYAALVPASPSERAAESAQAPQLLHAYADAVSVYRAWAAFLPLEVNQAVAQLLTGCEHAMTSRDPAAAGDQPPELRAAYLQVVTSIRASLGGGPLGPEPEAVLAQMPTTLHG